MTQNVIDGRRGQRFVPPYGLGEWIGLVGGIVVAVVVLALVGWNVVRLAEGETTVEALTCVDPTDSCNWSSYRVINDSNVPVVLRECQHHCEGGDTSDRLRTRGVRSVCVGGERSSEHAGLLGCRAGVQVAARGGKRAVPHSLLNRHDIHAPHCQERTKRVA